jgi:HNH endonuclease
MSRRKSPISGKAWQQLSFKERFLCSFKINKETACWEWLKVGSGGYGGIDFEGKTIAASRASWMFHNGEIKDDLFVLHRCDNRRCVNPKHLYLGDKKQNRKDFMERHPKSKQIIEEAMKARNAARDNFWRLMTDIEKKDFCDRRAKIQAQKFLEKKSLKDK